MKLLDLEEESHKPKIIVLRPQVDNQDVEELVDSKKTGYFRHLLKKPPKNEINVESLALNYEPFMILSGTYEADFLKRVTHDIKVSNNAREIILGDGVFPISHKSTFRKKISKDGKNKVELEVDEHIFVTEIKEITLDHHGTVRTFPYKLDSIPKEHYPEQVLEKNSTTKFEITTKDAIKKLEDTLQEMSFDYEVKNLNKHFTLDSITEVYVPIYEARLVGPKKKVEIMRIDGITKKEL